MADEHSLQLARSRDRDSNSRLVMGLAAATLAATYKILEEQANEIKKEERRLLFHSPKKYACRESIPLPHNSSWNHLLNCQDDTDETWFTRVALPKQSFLDLVNLCEQTWAVNPISAFRTDNISGETGQPRPQDLSRRELDCAGTVGIALKFLTSTDGVPSISEKFGVVETVGRKYIDFGLEILIHVLKDHPNAQIVWPVDDQSYLDEMAHLIHLYVPELANERQQHGINLVAFIDGVRFRIVNKWSDPAARKRDQSGEKKLTIRKIILITDPRGYIVAAGINCPGSWHDSKCAFSTGLYDIIQTTLPNGYNVAADTAFSGSIYGKKIVRILKENETIPFDLGDEELIELERLITRARQPGEWINRDVVKCFERLRHILGDNNELNSKRMLAACLVHNWRVSTCDRNQVKKFFQICKRLADQEAEDD